MNKFRKLRKEYCQTQAGMARELGISQAQYHKLENYESIAGIKTLYCLAKMGLNLNKFVTEYYEDVEENGGHRWS